MPDYNVPTVTPNNTTLGQGIVFIGPSGATPSVDFGAVRNIRVTPEPTKTELMQGAPQSLIHSFVSVNRAYMAFDMYEWDYNRFAYALAAGQTTQSGTEEVVTFGGEPTVTTVAVHLQHRMAQSGDTLNTYMWLAEAEDAPEHAYADDEFHTIPVRFQARRSPTNWAGVSLAAGAQLIEVERVL